MAGRIEALKNLTFPEAEWTPEEKPVAVVDGRAHCVADLDSRIEGSAAYVVGVNARSFPKLCEHLRVATLHCYEMRVADLAPLRQLDGLRELAIRWNTKVTDLEPVGALRSLETLVMEDTPKICDLSPLSRLRKLASLELSGGIWNRNTVASLEPVGALPALAELVMWNLAVLEGGLRPLARCSSLRVLQVANKFPTADFAYLSVHMPTTECENFAAWVPLDDPIGGKDVMVIGSRKPLLHSRRDAERLTRYEREFEMLKRRFCAERATSAEQVPAE